MSARLAAIFEREPMIRAITTMVGVSAMLVACATSAYELTTHAVITREAVDRSTLSRLHDSAQDGVIDWLGIRHDSNDLGRLYQHVGHTSEVSRRAFPDEPADLSIAVLRRANVNLVSAPLPRSLTEWIMLGAIREDDVVFEARESENPPQDDPDGVFNRVFNHFYDPFKDESLRSVPWSSKATDWAVKVDEAATLGRANRYSVTKARDYMWRALTLRLADGVTDVEFVASPEIASRRDLRLAYWASVFRSVGGVVHLLQDMAQPQHTRGDAHAGLGCFTLTLCAAGHASFYEHYVEGRATGATQVTLREGFFVRGETSEVSLGLVAHPLVYSGYPNPRLTRPSEFLTVKQFYSSSTLGGSRWGTGLANYANRGFYTAGTNVGRSSYPDPAPDGGGLTFYVMPDGTVRNSSDKVVSGTLVLGRGTVIDNVDSATLSRSSVALTSYGAFDQFLRPQGKSQFSLNHYNYADQAALLIPRAVAYSTALIDFIFRGRLEISVPDEGIYAVRDATASVCKDACGFDKIKLKVKNTTPNEAMGPGIMVAVVKFHRNACYQPDLSGEPGGSNFLGDSCRSTEEEIVVSNAVTISTLDADATIAKTFSFASGTPIPINATDVSLQVVFRGKLGNEDDAVVVTTKNIAETNYVAVHNSTDYRRLRDDLFESTPTGAADTFTNVTIGFGTTTPQVPVATLAALPAPGYAQLAFLGDRGTTKMTIDLVPSKVSFGHPLNYAALPVSEIYLPSGGTGYDSTWSVNRTRGIYTRFVQSILYGAGTTMYICRGEDPIATCTQSSLSPLTPAHGRPLQIAFN